MQFVGSLWVTTLWVSGVWGAFAAAEAAAGKRLWQKTAGGVWVLHTLALLGTIGLLLYLLLAHRYEFYYAWAHGSRLLPTAYVTAALWEGQEGSFLLWMLWHCVLGWALIIAKDKHKWPLLAGILGINGFLATFLLGLSGPTWAVGVAAALVWVGMVGRVPLPWWGAGLGLLGVGLLWLPQGVRFVLAAVGAGVFLLWRKEPLWPAGLWAILMVLPASESWGSFPFLYLWEVKPEVTPDTLPADGNGLNPLLQSFWMVVHPPVLFGGYAAASLPFLEGLITVQQGGLTMEASRRLLRFLWFGVAFLGLGIALGAYWAYETLNFGGYWNWDPVENASFAPWLVLVAAAHLLWVWRRQRSYEAAALTGTLLGFPLVLYSAYLTRSGVLAESSVHSFTDLGLGEWLWWGVLSSLLVTGLAAGYLYVQKRQVRPMIKVPALWIGALLLIGMAGVLLLLTSLPVLNKFLGLQLALGANALQVYYEWMGLLAVPVLGLMGYALIRAYKARGWEAVGWAAGALLAGGVGLLWWIGWDFVYHESYRALLQGDIINRFRAAVFLLLDDLLWGGALVAIGAAVAVALQRPLRVVGGAVLAHAGFGLMLIGAILSSGYQQVLSQNFNPRSPSSADNLFLPLGGEAIAVGYKVRYEGLLLPVPPLHQVRPLLRTGGQTLWRFTDSLGYAYQVWLPDNLLATAKEPFSLVSTPPIQQFLEANLALLPVEPADRRFRYKVQLTHLEKGQTYPLLLEADLSESSGLLAHPAHIRLWHGDIYIHLTSLPKAEGSFLRQGIVDMGLRDTAQWGELTFVLERLTEVEGAPHPTFRAWLAVWKGLPELVQRIPVQFAIQEKALQVFPARVPVLGLSVQLEGFSMAEKKLRFRVAVRQQPDAFITVKILYKPFIGLFWGGIGLVLVGAVWAFWRHRRA